MAEELLEVGAYTSFYEREIGRRADRFGNVLHVASAYETKISPTAQDFVERGVNSLQLIREDGCWRIISLCWDDNALFNMEGMVPVSSKEVSKQARTALHDVSPQRAGGYRSVCVSAE